MTVTEKVLSGIIGLFIVLSVVSGVYFAAFMKDCKTEAREECISKTYNPIECKAHIENICGAPPPVDLHVEL